MPDSSKPPRCPRCGSLEARVDPSLANASIVAANVALYPIIFLLIGLTRGAFNQLADCFISLTRQCRDCGMRYRGRRRLQYSCLRCPNCRYDLRLNQSGVCPECGWQLTEEFRRAVEATHPTGEAIE